MYIPLAEIVSIHRDDFQFENRKNLIGKKGKIKYAEPTKRGYVACDFVLENGQVVQFYAVKLKNGDEE